MKCFKNGHLFPKSFGVIRALLFLSVVLTASSAHHAFGQSGELKLKVNGLDERTGQLCIALYNTKESYMLEDKVFRVHREKVSGRDELTVSLAALPYGRYAVLLFLDENANEKLDKNMLGVPKEKYGFSGSEKPLFRAPRFEEAAVTFDQPNAVIYVQMY